MYIMMVRYPVKLFSHSIENIKQIMEVLMSLGYTREETVTLTQDCPKIFDCSIEDTKQIIEGLISLYISIMIFCHGSFHHENVLLMSPLSAAN